MSSSNPEFSIPGKRYSPDDLANFVQAADIDFKSRFISYPLEEQRRLFTSPAMEPVIQAIWGDNAASLQENLFPQIRINRIAELYKKYSHTSPFLTDMWSQLWEKWGKLMDTDVTVTRCNWSSDEIRDLENRGRMLIFLPDNLSAAEDLPILQEIIPQKDLAGGWRQWAFMDTPSDPSPRSWTSNFYDLNGWLSVESAPRISNEQGYRQERQIPTKDTLARKATMHSGRLIGQTANVYILGSVFSHLFTGEYFDEDIHDYYPSLLFGSAIHHSDSKGPGFVAYGSKGDIWSWCGPIDYSLARTVELRFTTPQNVVTPEQRFGNYKEIYPPIEAK